MREEGLHAWLSLACFTVSGVWWHKYVRLKLFQDVLVNYKIAGRDNYKGAGFGWLASAY